jgi:hypothetical protein
MKRYGPSLLRLGTQRRYGQAQSTRACSGAVWAALCEYSHARVSEWKQNPCLQCGPTRWAEKRLWICGATLAVLASAGPSLESTDRWMKSAKKDGRNLPRPVEGRGLAWDRDSWDKWCECGAEEVPGFLSSPFATLVAYQCGVGQRQSKGGLSLKTNERTNRALNCLDC